MAHRGESKHLKRIAVPKVVLIKNKKKYTWVINPSPGPHNKKHSVPLLVIIRDILGFAKTARETKRILNARLVSVDGINRMNLAFPVGLFDVLHLLKADKYYRLFVDNKGRLFPKEVEKSGVHKKLLKVVGKHVVKKTKITISLNDGKSIIADNHVKVGDSILLNLNDNKIEKILKLEKGATCLITEGKHAGTVAKLSDIIERQEGKPAEAKLETKDGEFITVAKYLFVVDSHFISGSTGASHEQ